jgi:CRP/FNR family transcriptional regulator, cyclic AMP receptor protein
MTESVITRIDKAAMVRVLHDEPKFTERFMAYLLARKARVEEDLIDQLFNSSEKRLARALQETLAEIVGTTRSQVSHFTNKFRRLGLISYNGHLQVHSSLLNMVLHETPQIRRDDPGSE